tara:strand:- start:277 stop:462 length:186 start_codon:yes stop_codon:yes gene_type:complete
MAKRYDIEMVSCKDGRPFSHFYGDDVEASLNETLDILRRDHPGQSFSVTKEGDTTRYRMVF